MSQPTTGELFQLYNQILHNVLGFSTLLKEMNVEFDSEQRIPFQDLVRQLQADATQHAIAIDRFAIEAHIERRQGELTRRQGQPDRRLTPRLVKKQTG